MRYISVDFRTRIVDAYRNIHGLELSNEELDRELFGDPEMRKAIDRAYDDADQQIDRDRFAQCSSEWFYYLASKLPKLKKREAQQDTRVTLKSCSRVDSEGEANNLEKAADQLVDALKTFIFSLLKVLEK